MKVKRIIGLVALWLAAGVLSAHASTISLDVTSPVNVGSVFDVRVQVNDVFAGRPDDLLVAFGFDVILGPGSIFEYTGATVNSSLFEDVSGFPGGPMVAGLAAGPSFVIGPSDFSGPLTLATLHLRALDAGAAPISIFGDRNLFQGLLFLGDPIDTINASNTVSAAVPEPSSLILLLSGVPILLWIASRKRRA